MVQKIIVEKEMYSFPLFFLRIAILQIRIQTSSSSWTMPANL